MRKKKHFVAKAAVWKPNGTPFQRAEVLRSGSGSYELYTTVGGSSTYQSTERAKEIATAMNALEAKRSKDRRAAARRRKARS